MNQFKKVSH